MLVTDLYLRDEFPPKGSVRARRSGETPTDIFQNRLADLSNVVLQLKDSHRNLSEVRGDDGQSLSETDGLDPSLCDEWREVLRNLDDDLNAWARRFRQKYGTKAIGSRVDDLADAPGTDDDADEEYDTPTSEWDDDEEKEPTDA